MHTFWQKKPPFSGLKSPKNRLRTIIYHTYYTTFVKSHPLCLSPKSRLYLGFCLNGIKLCKSPLPLYPPRTRTACHIRRPNPYRLLCSSPRARSACHIVCPNTCYPPHLSPEPVPPSISFARTCTTGYILPEPVPPAIRLTPATQKQREQESERESLSCSCSLIKITVLDLTSNYFFKTFFCQDFSLHLGQRIFLVLPMCIAKLTALKVGTYLYPHFRHS